MQLEKVAIHFIPPPNLPLPVSDKEKIDFNRFLYPFIQLLNGSYCYSLIMASVAIGNYLQRMVLATQVVMFRLINSPSFDPTHPSFKELLDKLEDQIPDLEQQVERLEQRFWQDHLIARDIQELRKLNTEVSETLHHLQRYVNTLEGRKNRFPIQDQLENVKNSFQKLDDRIDDYCIDKGEMIIEKVQKAVGFFTKGGTGVELPKDIRQQLLLIWKDLDHAMRSRVRSRSHTFEGRRIYSAMRDIRDQVRLIEKQAVDEPRSASFAHPLKLRNIGNSCYLDSVLEAFLCIEQVREQLNEPIVRDSKRPATDHAKKLAIQQEILQFINAQPTNQGEETSMTQMEFILYLLGGPSLYRLRDAIFKSGFHHEFTDMSDLKRQLDAASVAELLTDEFLPNTKFRWQGHSTTPVFPGLSFVKPIEEISVLQVPLRNREENHKLSRLLHFVIGRHRENEKDPTYQRTYDPKEGRVIEGKEKEAASVAAAAPTKVDEFVEEMRFLELPPVLVIQFKRFLNHQSGSSQLARLVKDNRPVILPENGILDLTQYYDPPEGKTKQARYRIKSMVIHGGSLHGGHYYSNVEINGKYYQCDDTDPKGYQEITKREFFGRKDPYLLVLERIPEE